MNPLNRNDPRTRYGACSPVSYHSSFAEDVDLYQRAGIDGMGIWEYKLSSQPVGESIETFREGGLTATYCFPEVPGALYSDGGLFARPTDLGVRIQRFTEGIERLAAFDPLAVVCLAGAPLDSDDPASARNQTIEGLRQGAHVAGELGTRLALEVIRGRPTDGSGFARSIPEALDLIEETEMPNIDIMLDIWHVWDDPNVLRDIERFVDRIVAVQVNDWAPTSQGWWDRLLPGDGELDLGGFCRALEEAGYSGWYELEVFSDDGTFGRDLGDRSLWRQDPESVLARGKAGFERLWHATE